MNKILFGSVLKGTQIDSSDVDIIYKARDVREALKAFEKEYKPDIYIISRGRCVTYVDAYASGKEYEVYIITCSDSLAKSVMSMADEDAKLAVKLSDEEKNKVRWYKETLSKCGVYGNYYGVPGVLIERMVANKWPETVLFGFAPHTTHTFRFGYDYNRAIALDCIKTQPSGDPLSIYLRYVSPYVHSVFNLEYVFDLPVMLAVLHTFKWKVRSVMEYAFATRINNSVVVGYRNVYLPVEVHIPPRHEDHYIEGHYGVVFEKIDADISKFPEVYKRILNSFKLVVRA